MVLVPEGGRGEVWQRSLSTRRLKRQAAVAAAGVVVLLVAAGLQLATMSKVFGHDELVAENAALRERLDSMEGRLAELEPLVDRVKGYDEQLRDLASKQVLPGFGALSEEEWEERQRWMDGIVPDFERDEPLDEDVWARSAHTRERIEELVLVARSIDLGQIEANLERLGSVSDVLPKQWPVEGVLTSPFGYRISPYGRRQWRFHGGIDLAAPYGTPISSTNDGLIVYSDYDPGHGLMVEVDHGGGVASRYCHMSRIYAFEGDTVIAGDVLGLVGSTGVSTGPHLHYELVMDGERVDPLGYLP